MKGGLGEAGAGGPIAHQAKIAVLDRSNLAEAERLAQGVYTLSGSELEVSDLLILASGSEVALAFGAVVELEKKGIEARVVSFPSWELFEPAKRRYCLARFRSEWGSRPPSPKAGKSTSGPRVR